MIRRKSHKSARGGTSEAIIANGKRYRCSAVARRRAVLWVRAQAQCTTLRLQPEGLTKSRVSFRPRIGG
jgi:hypothetical protein